MKYKEFKRGLAWWFRWHGSTISKGGVAWGGMAGRRKSLQDALQGTLFKDHATMPPMPPVLKTYFVKASKKQAECHKQFTLAWLVKLLVTPSQNKKSPSFLRSFFRGACFMTRRSITQ